jgi:hypothetical protein
MRVRLCSLSLCLSTSSNRGWKETPYANLVCLTEPYVIPEVTQASCVRTLADTVKHQVPYRKHNDH